MCLKLSLPNGDFGFTQRYALISQDIMRLHHKLQFSDTNATACIKQKPFWRGTLNDQNIRRQKLSDHSVPGLISKAQKMSLASIHIAYIAGRWVLRVCGVAGRGGCLFCFVCFKAKAIIHLKT